MSCLADVGLAKKIEGGDHKLLRVPIIDGQNNHHWKSTTPVMQDAFKSSGRYPVDVSTSPGKKGTGKSGLLFTTRMTTLSVTLPKEKAEATVLSTNLL